MHPGQANQEFPHQMNLDVVYRRSLTRGYCSAWQEALNHKTSSAPFRRPTIQPLDQYHTKFQVPSSSPLPFAFLFGVAGRDYSFAVYITLTVGKSLDKYARRELIMGTTS